MSKDAVQLLGEGVSTCDVPVTPKNPCAVVAVVGHIICSSTHIGGLLIDR